MSDTTEDNKCQQPDDPQPENIQLPPQVKFGIAVMEMDDGSVVRMPINPHGLHLTMGMIMRLMYGELEDLRAEILAIKIKNLTRPLAPPPTGSGLGGGLVDLS